MKIQVNNEPFELLNAATIPFVLDKVKIPSRQGIAVAVNNIVIAKSTWDTYLVKENDSLTIIRATQGG